MTFTTYLKPRAERDLLEAIEWYEDRAKLGAALYMEFGGLLNLLCESTLLFSQYEGDVRRALLKRFPYAVYYEVQPSRLIVHAVLHMKRHPSSWR
ncbi:MAG TPA: type II toxin-antitoxin system RelE/ParE family toxin [Steroidobacteraceae bacterium]|nr:type II toxin-antitoxin system RelE/ParE family toxin [Steroidobacteraceae bacterium]